MPFQIKSKPKQPHPSENSIRYHLHAHLRTSREARQYESVHASDLMGTPDFCPREYSLGMLYGEVRPDDSIYTQDAVTYAYGYAVEDLVRKWYMELDMAVGHWECRHCEEVYLFQKKPSECAQCGHLFFDYKEVKFVSPISGVSARPDLFLDLGKPKLTLVEIKSIDKDVFKKLAAPLAEHRWRTNLYMRLAEESGSPYAENIDFDEAWVLYVTKGGYGVKDDEVRKWKLLDGDWSPFKDFKIARSDEDTDSLLELAGEVEKYKKTGKVPFGICQTSLVKRAKYCKMAEQCWGGKH